MNKLPRKRGRRKAITPEQEAAICAAKGRQIDIAIRFGVTQATVSKIKKDRGAR